MTQKNSLMEWLEQTRRVNKAVDIICMETIDSIINALPYLRPKFLNKNKRFFNKYCDYYHKDNPVDLIKRKKTIRDMKCDHCEPMEEYVQDSIDRCWKGIDMVKVQWMEVIDLFWERPELVNPAFIDDYIRCKISEICKEKNKKNPLINGMWKHFGKHWKDKNGEWRDERRKRS